MIKSRKGGKMFKWLKSFLQPQQKQKYLRVLIDPLSDSPPREAQASSAPRLFIRSRHLELGREN